MNQLLSDKRSTPAGGVSRIEIGPKSFTTTTGGTITVKESASGSIATKRQETKQIETAVYGYIRAIRALGRTRINTVEIAQSLGLPVRLVDQTIKALQKKGVKLAD